MNEAERLGLEMGMFNGAGWSSTGAAFVTPDRAMQEVAWTEADVKGPGRVKIKLAIPRAALGIERDMKKDPIINRRYYMPREKVEGYFRNLAVFAVPAIPAGQKPWQLKDWRNKAAFGKMADRFTPDDRRAPAGQVISLDQLIDISRFMNAEGELDWEAPAGDWTILRMGYQPTGRNNHPASEGGRGLEIDKMSPAALDFYWDNFLDRVVQTAGGRIGKTFFGISLDSYEVGHQNWNRDFACSFSNAMGYDLRKYLPVITGRVVQSVDFTERVLWDYRKVVGDLIATNYFGRMAGRAHAVGLQFADEPYGIFGNTSDPVVAGTVDIPTCEFWAYDSKQLGRIAEAKVAASAAHTYGRKIVDAEAFTGTAGRIFETYPGGIKAQGDYFMAQGVNRFSFHTWAHDPYGIPPGLGLGTYGSRFDNRNTWWPYRKPWHEYLSRCFYLLRQGEFVGDLLCYSGDEAPLRSEELRREMILPDLPHGTDYAIANSEILHQLRLENGWLQTEKGASFRILVLPDTPWIALADLEKITDLLTRGAVVVGKPPVSLPGNFRPGEGEKFAALVKTIWGSCDGRNVTSNQVGNGVIYAGLPLAEVLKRHGIAADFTFTHTTKTRFRQALYPGSDIEFIHRRAGGDEIYFLSNQHDAGKTVVAQFRVTGKIPEVWMPDSGKIYRLPDAKTLGEQTQIPLHFGPQESYFIVFREAAKVSAVEPAPWLRPEKIVQDLSSDWSVSFPLGKTNLIEPMPKLVSWTELKDASAKYHSGDATYRRTFDWKPAARSAAGRTFSLDLGDVQVIARVTVNGKDCGVAWKKPYRVEVTPALQPGVNTVEITVANLWVNRIIGDQQYPDDVAWTAETGSTAAGLGLAGIPDWVKNKTERPEPRRVAFYAWRWPHLTADKELLPSGLLGPVRLLESSTPPE
jgi:hypothetical protein